MRRLCALLLLALFAQAEDVLILKSGVKITGRITELGEHVEVLRDLRSLRYPMRDVLRIEYDEELHPSSSPSDTLDVVRLHDGRVFTGQCSLAPRGTRINIVLENGTRVGFARSEVIEVIWQRGGTGAIGDVRTRIDELLAEYASREPDERLPVRRKLFEIGGLAVPYLESLQVATQGATKEAANFCLQAVFLAPQTSKRLRQAMPEFAVFWLDPDKDVQIQVLRRASLEDPEGVVPFLRRAVESSDRHPAVKAFAISQLAVLAENDELLEILDASSDGRLRMAVAVGLGSNGIYAGIPVLIEALKHEDVEVRAMAIAHLKAWTGDSKNFFPDDSEERRASGVELWEEWWEENAQEVLEVAAKMVRGPDGVSPAEKEQALELSRLANEAWTEMSRLPVDDDEGRTFARDKADFYFDRSLSADPTNLATRLANGVFQYVVDADTTTAEREFDLLLKLLPPGTNARERSQVFYHRARIAMARSQWDRANELLVSAMAHDRDDIEARSAMGELRITEAIRRPALLPEHRIQLLEEALDELDIALEAMIERRSEFSRTTLNLLADESLGSFERGPLLRTTDEVKDGLKAQHGRIHLLRGRAQLALNRDGEAVESLRAAHGMIPAEWRSEEEERRLTYLIESLGNQED